MEVILFFVFLGLLSQLHGFMHFPALSKQNMHIKHIVQYTPRITSTEPKLQSLDISGGPIRHMHSITCLFAKQGKEEEKVSRRYKRKLDKYEKKEKQRNEEIDGEAILEQWSKENEIKKKPPPSKSPFDKSIKKKIRSNTRLSPDLVPIDDMVANNIDNGNDYADSDHSQSQDTAGNLPISKSGNENNSNKKVSREPSKMSSSIKNNDADHETADSESGADSDSDIESTVDTSCYNKPAIDDDSNSDDINDNDSNMKQYFDEDEGVMFSVPDTSENGEVDDSRRDPESSVFIDSDSTSDGQKSLVPAYAKRWLKKIRRELSEEGHLPTVEREEKALPVVAVIGRPNTGKSTFVNRICNTYHDGSIVHDEPGITRDRYYQLATFLDYNFQVVDTGGIVFEDTEDIFADHIKEQALMALAEAKVVLFVVDGQSGITPLDQEISRWLHRNCRVPVYVAVNKCESVRDGSALAVDFLKLGFGEPFPLSAIHGNGVSILLEQALPNNIEKVEAVKEQNTTNVAIIGRPNAGKSSLFNKIYGRERVIVSSIAGTTRDSIDELIEIGNKSYRIIDTAGIRRKRRVEKGAEFLMVNRAFKAIRRSEVSVLVIDSTTGIVEQDRLIADRICAEGRGCVIVLNKWDAVEYKDEKSYIKALEYVRNNLPQLRWAEVLFISAKTGQRVNRIFTYVNKAAVQFRRRVSTAVLNEVTQDAITFYAPIASRQRVGRIYYSVQVTSGPPTIVHYVNDPKLFTEAYQKYLDKKLREALGFEGVPIKYIFRGKTLRSVQTAARKGEINTGEWKNR